MIFENFYLGLQKGAATSGYFPKFSTLLTTMSGDDIGPGVLQTKKKLVHDVGFFEQHMPGTTISICIFCKIL